MTRPVIGICASQPTLTLNFNSTQTVACVPNVFIRLIENCGGIPLIIPVLSDPRRVMEFENTIDGLLLCGGEDIDSSTYGAACEIDYDPRVQGTGTPYCRPIKLRPNPLRDHAELLLGKLMHQHKKPLLGICRGMQIINVCLGGTLQQEINETSIQHSLGEDSWVHHHPIMIEEGTLAWEIIKQDQYVTSSVHHQAIERLGEELRVSARATDGIPEIIESIHNDRYTVGIQGHPEFTMKNFPLFMGFFDCLIRRSIIRKKEHVN